MIVLSAKYHDLFMGYGERPMVYPPFPERDPTLRKIHAYVKRLPILSTKAPVDAFTNTIEAGRFREAEILADSLSMLGIHFGDRAMLDAIIHNDTRLFHRLQGVVLGLGVDSPPFAKDSDYWLWRTTGVSLLHLAFLWRRFDMATFLMENGSDPRLPVVIDPKGIQRLTKSTADRRIVIDIPTLLNTLKVPASLRRDLDIHIRDASTRSRRQDAVTNPKMTMNRRVQQWSLGTYQQIQLMRRGNLRGWKGKILPLFKKPSAISLTNNVAPRSKRNYSTPHEVNNALAEYMRRHSLRVPQMPRQYGWQPSIPLTQKGWKPEFLYRGVHGPIKKSLDRRGYYDDKGWIATTTNSGISHMFASKGGVILRLRISALERGTPWIWFSSLDRPSMPQSNVLQSTCPEDEVLLPPGRLTITGRAPETWKVPVYDAVYSPHYNATSLRGRRIWPSTPKK